MQSVLNRDNAKNEAAGYLNMALGSRSYDTFQVCCWLAGRLNKLPRDLWQFLYLYYTHSDARLPEGLQN